jgi:uncharacterized membrane protein
MKIEDEISIDAPREVVWAVTSELERWPEWTPTVESLERVDEGEFKVGSSALIKQPGLPLAEWIVTDLVPGKRFTWKSRVQGIHMAASHELTSDGSGMKNVLRIEISGLVAFLLWPWIRLSVRRTLKQENQGLKAACEKRWLQDRESTG